MPLVLRREQITSWLNDPQAAADILHLQPPQLEKTAADAQLRLW